MSEASRPTRHMLKAADDGDIDDYNKWVGRGADVMGTDKKGQNVLHFLVKQGKFRMLKQVLNSQPEVHHLVNKVDNKGWSTLHLCCIQHPVELRTLESLMTAGGDPYLENTCGNCKDLVDHDAKEFLQWRKRHHNGLPLDIKTLPNEYIMEYINKFGHLDDDFTIMYDKVLETGNAETTDILYIILGPQGVGKTTLARGVMEVKVRDKGPTPTKGIDIYTRRITVDLEDWSRTDNGDQSEVTTCQQEFVDNVLKRMRDQRPSINQTGLMRQLSLKIRPDKDGSKQKTGCPSEKANVTIFDFSGDNVYEGIQHLFMTSNAVYVLVFSLELYPRMDEMLDGVFERLQYISLYNNGQHPSVILVGTHLDKVPESSRNHRTISQEVEQTIFKHDEVAAFAKDHVKEIFLINGMDVTKEREEFWHATVRAATETHQLRYEFPARWLALERELLRYRLNGHKVMTFGNLCTIAKELEVPILEEGQVLVFLRFMHQKKSLLICINPLSLTPDDPIVLDTKWLANRLVELLSVKQPLISPEFVESFLESDTKTEAPKKKSLMTVISQLSLIAEPLPEKTSNEAGHCILSCMLPPVNDELITSLLTQGSQRSTLCFFSNQQFIPATMRDRLLAICINRFEVVSDHASQERLLYRDNGCFKINPGVNLLIKCSKSRIKLTLFSSSDCQLYPGIGGVVRETVSTLFDDHNQYHYRLLYDDNSCDVLLTEAGAIKSTTLQLPHEYKAIISKDRAIWFGRNSQKIHIPVKGFSLDPQHDHKLTPKRLSHVAKHIGNSYVLVFAFLGLDNAVVGQARWRHRHLDFRSQLTKVLLRWRATQKHAASLEKLVEAMKINNVPFADLLQDPVWAAETVDAETNDLDSVIPDIDLSSSPTTDDLAVIAGVVGSSVLVFFLELDVDYHDIKKAMELHQSQSVETLSKYLLEIWGQRSGSKATFYRVVRAMVETNLDTSKLKNLNPRISQC